MVSISEGINVVVSEQNEQPDTTRALARLAAQAREEMAMLAYPNRSWVSPVLSPGGGHVYDVLVVGGGQAGTAIAFSLKREGVDNVLVIDSQPRGEEGVWENFARMHTLRTPKYTTGIEDGVASLSAPAWYQTRYGLDAWNAIDRIERTRWAEYIRWFRDTTAIQLLSETTCVGYGPMQNGRDQMIAISVRSTQHGETTNRTLFARRIVLATGYDGAGRWHIPEHIANAVSPDRLSHSNGPIDFKKMHGRRIGVLGHAASAFDNAGALLEAGAASVDLCFRRDSLPAVNLNRAVEFTGFLKHFYDLPDDVRWDVSKYCELMSEPPTQNGVNRALAFPNFRMHAGTPWLELHDEEAGVRVVTPRGEFIFDYLVCATGSALDYDARADLRPLKDAVQRWRHRFTAPADNGNPALAEFPYLGASFEYLPLDPTRDSWVSRIHAFNISSAPSMGPTNTSTSGHKYSVPRLVSGITRALMVDQAKQLMPTLYNCDVREVVL